MISGAELVVKALIDEKVDVCFAYPGGQAIDLFDALYQRKEFRVILPRHEQGLIHAADGYARSTGKVGVCLVTSGPGATNLIRFLSAGLYHRAGFNTADWEGRFSRSRYGGNLSLNC